MINKQDFDKETASAVLLFIPSFVGVLVLWLSLFFHGNWQHHLVDIGFKITTSGLVLILSVFFLGAIATLLDKEGVE